MAKFKVGDRVRCIDVERSDGRLRATWVYTVMGYDHHGYVLLDGVSKRPCGFLEHRFVLDNLKLEKGATVRLKDGVDEWVVMYVAGNSADIARPDSGAFVYGVPPASLVVVKEKPEDPKPDYYVNCKGAEPKDGDVFTDSHDQVCLIRGDHYHVCGPHLEKGFPLAGGVRVNAINNTRTKRTLAVRDGKPYTG